MKKYFGFKRVFSVFSGRRGFHMWVCDPRVIHMTHLERSALVDILAQPSAKPDDFTNGMYEILSKHFNHNSLLRNRCTSPAQHRQIVFETLWPRIDLPVSRDNMQHLHKVPLVLHPSTNAICILMGPAASRENRFRPSQDTYIVHHLGPERVTEIVAGCANRIIEILKEE
jgi:DNA primase catalytic subunit